MQDHNEEAYQTYKLSMEKRLIDGGTGARQGIKGARQGLGRTGERLAEQRLLEGGYRILERNFRCRYGEIDLVAEHGEDLVFVEVKTRRGEAFGRPEEAVTKRKLRTIEQVAACYLDLHACYERSWRVDVVGVQLSVGGKLEEIRVYPHAFIE